jgi:hypothetical protein
MGREEGEQCRSKRHCFGFFFFLRKRNVIRKKKKNLGVTQKWVMTFFISYLGYRMHNIMIKKNLGIMVFLIIFYIFKPPLMSKNYINGVFRLLESHKVVSHTLDI